MRQHTRVPEHTNDSAGLMTMKEQLYLLILLPGRAKSKGDLSGAKTVTYTRISNRANGPCKQPDRSANGGHKGVSLVAEHSVHLQSRLHEVVSQKIVSAADRLSWI